jgi:signal transduction histidine kinase
LPAPGLDLALQAARSCADLTKRLMGFARRQALDPMPIDLDNELTRLHDMMARRLGKSIEVEIACREGLWPAHVDSSQLETAIINLVINARDAMPEGGRLTEGNMVGGTGIEPVTPTMSKKASLAFADFSSHHSPR